MPNRNPIDESFWEENVFKIPVIINFISYILLFTYPCNPYLNLSWNNTTPKEYFETLYPVQNFPDKGCWINCQAYQIRVELILNDSSSYNKSPLQEFKNSEPNPFCYVSQSKIDEYKKNHPESLNVVNDDLLKYEVGRSIASEKHTEVAMSAILGFSCFVFQIWVADIWSNRPTNMVLQKRFFVALVFDMVFHIAAFYFQAKAADYLTCSYDVSDKELVGHYKIQHFCDSTVTVLDIIEGKKHTVNLPGSGYTMFQISLGLKCMNFMVILWGCVYYFAKKREVALRRAIVQAAAQI